MTFIRFADLLKQYQMHIFCVAFEILFESGDLKLRNL